MVNQNAPLNTGGDPASWRPSSTLGGTPGLANPPPIDFPPIVVNEVLANSPGTKDAVELYNPSSSAANLGGWFLTDNPGTPKKFRIPDGTVFAAGGYLVYRGNSVNPHPGMSTRFALT